MILGAAGLLGGGAGLDGKNAERLEKFSTGIEGLDDITVGGLPLRCTTLLMGGPGCGKTVVALQVLVHAAIHLDLPGIFVAFEENARRVAANADTFGWNLDEVDERQLFFVDACMRVSIRSRSCQVREEKSPADSPRL